jgi:hypothetical protein
LKQGAIDNMTKKLAARANRRTVLGGALAGVSAAGLASSLPALAQDAATPVPSLQDLAEQSVGASSAEFLFVQSFQSGT